MDIVLYTTHCPKCKVLQTKLGQASINYSTIQDISIMESKGINSVPVLEVDGKLLNFMEALNFVNSYIN